MIQNYYFSKNISTKKFKLSLYNISQSYKDILKINYNFASNYNLNIMLRVQEVCKQKGITMQILAKRMGVTYQALYAAVSGNPTIGKLREIAKVLNVSVVELIEEEDKNTITCPNCGKKFRMETK